MRFPGQSNRAVIALAGMSCSLLAAEPNYQQAAARWPDMRRPIAFLGCKEHLHEFAVMWNGNISATLVTRPLIDANHRLLRDRPHDSYQVSFSLSDRPSFEGRERDREDSEASLEKGYLPLTRISLRQGETRLLQQAFVSTKNSGCIASSGDSPVFLRLRFTVAEIGKAKGPIRLWVQIAKNHTRYSMDERTNVRIEPVAPVYGRPLQKSGSALVDSQGLVVMHAGQPFEFHAQLPEALSSAALRESQMDRNVTGFTIPRKPGAHIDLVFPFYPVPQAEIEEVTTAGFERAWAEVSACWERTIERGMRIEVPEKAIMNLWRFSPTLSFITADRYPNGDAVLKTSPHWYEAMWPTPVSMNIVSLAQRGYRQEALSYLDTLLDAGRRSVVPSTGKRNSFRSTEGFISGARDYLSISWVGDHGAILWSAAETYLLTRDDTWLRRWLPSLLAGLEWIAREREVMKLHGIGLLPVGRATDADSPARVFWTDAWVYRGLAAMCRVLEAIGHPETSRWARERDDYRAAFQKLWKREIARTMRWPDSSGVLTPFVPWAAGQRHDANLHPFYLDAGPMFLGVAGLVDADDETMTWAMKWLTEGPDAGSVRPDWANHQSRPSLAYEMSSVEPCYSWNIYLRFYRNEREKFLEGFYSLAAGSVSRRFLGAYETRDGIPGVPVGNAVIDSHLRNMLIFEDLPRKSIHLLRNSPSAWLRPGSRIRVEAAETYFGEIKFEFAVPAGDRIEGQIAIPNRQPMELLRLHLYHPDGKPIRGSLVNGQPLRPAGKDSLEIAKPAGKVQVTAFF